MLPLVFDLVRAGTQLNDVARPGSIGLALAKRLAEMHGGDVLAASAGGPGYVFKVRPRKKMTASRPAAMRRMSRLRTGDVDRTADPAGG